MFRRVLIIILVVVLLALGGYYFLGKKHTASGVPAQSNNTTASTSSGTPQNSDTSNNTGPTSNTAGNNGTTGPGPVQLDQNSNVAFDINTPGALQSDPKTKSMMQVQEYKVSFPKANGQTYTAIYAKVRLTNGSSQPLVADPAANPPSIYMMMPPTDLPASMNPPGGSDSVIIPVDQANAKQLGVDISGKVTIAPGQSVDYVMAWALPGQFDVSKLKDPKITVTWVLGATALQSPLAH